MKKMIIPKIECFYLEKFFDILNRLYGKLSIKYLNEVFWKEVTKMIIPKIECQYLEQFTDILNRLFMENIP